PAARLGQVVRVVYTAHQQVDRAVLHQLRDVYGEGRVTALVTRDQLATHPDRGFPIDGVEVQDRPLAAPLVGKVQRPAVPGDGVFRHLTDAGGRALGSERHDHLTVQLGRTRSWASTTREGPGAVERLPYRARQRGPWVPARVCRRQRLYCVPTRCARQYDRSCAAHQSPPRQRPLQLNLL